MESFLSAEGLISLFTLTLMEIVLGIDNVIFISIVAGKLPPGQEKQARNLGLMLALGFRIALLLSISWIVGLTYPVIAIPGLPHNFELSWRDLILIGGGLFLMGKTILEMHHKLEGEEDSGKDPHVNAFWPVVAQIVVLDIVFSFDSILTAIGLVQDVRVMIAAVVISLSVMLVAAGPISKFVNDRPTVKMLALSFLLLIGFMLVAEGFEQHVEKGYLYFAMAFSFTVELLNLRLRKKMVEPVRLRERITDEE